MARRDSEIPTVADLRVQSDRDIERLEDPDLDEVSEVQLERVADRAATRAAQLSRPDADDSTPAAARGLVAILLVLPPWGRVVVTLAVIGAAVAGGHQLGWW
jgi:hypothetical protein